MKHKTTKKGLDSSAESRREREAIAPLIGYIYKTWKHGGRKCPFEFARQEHRIRSVSIHIISTKLNKTKFVKY